MTKEISGTKWGLTDTGINWEAPGMGGLNPASVDAGYGQNDYQKYLDDIKSAWEEADKSLKYYSSDNVDLENKLIKLAKEKGSTEVLTNKSLLDEKKTLSEQLTYYKAILKYWNVDLENKKSGSDKNPFSLDVDKLKNQLKLMEEVRKFYLQLEGLTTGTGLEYNIPNDMSEVFGGKQEYAKAMESYTDEPWRKALENLKTIGEDIRKKASDVGNKAGIELADSFIAGINSTIADIDKENVLEQESVKIALKKMYENIDFKSINPFGAGIDLSVTEIVSSYDKALKEIEAKIAEFDAEGARLTKKEDIAEFKVKRDLAIGYYNEEKKRLKANAEEKLAALATQYTEEQLSSAGLLDIFKDINSANLSQLLKIKEVLNSMTTVNLSPETKAALDALGLTVDELLVKLGILTGSNKKIVNLEIFDEFATYASSAAESMVELGDSLSDDTDEKVAKLGKSLSMLGTELKGVVDVASAFSKDKVSGIIATVGQVVRQVSQNIDQQQKHAEAIEQLSIAQNKSATNYEMWANSVILNTKYVTDALGNLTEIQNDVFGVANPYSEAISGAAAYKDAIDGLVNSTVKITKTEKNWKDWLFFSSRKGTTKTEDMSLQDALNNEAKIQTGTSTTGALWWKKTKSTYSSLASVLGVDEIDIFSDEQYQKALANYDLLDEQTKAMVDQWGEYKDAATEAIDQVNSAMEDLVGNLGSDWMDAIVDGYINGANAADTFKNSVEGTVEAMLEQMIKSTLLAPAFAKLQKELYAALGWTVNEDGTINTDASVDPEKIDWAKIVGEWYDNTGIDSIITNSQAEMDKLKEAFKTYGLDLWTGDESGGLSKGIQSITEDTANIIAAYLNTIRYQVILNTGYLQQLVANALGAQALANQQLAHLAAIRDNTGRTADLLEAVSRGTKTLKVA
ncbi:MAG: hypothetical protein WC310_05810 [Patescibacteria group bacterium]|jgi:hypothetical protein